jgi:D-3-phosphoglycerate dehydrogenase
MHTPLNEKTKGLINTKQLAMVKPSVRIINCARGGVIDEEALFQAVESGKVAGAAFDVFTEEPAKNNILFKSDKILVTPHLAASTAEAQTGAALGVSEQVITVLNGKPARHAVNMPLISPETLAVIGPFLEVARQIGRLVYQLGEGQMSSIVIKYEGEIANHDTAALKATIVGGLIETVSEERVNLVNANLIAQRRGLKITEQKDPTCENYGNLITLEVKTTAGMTTVAGTVMRGEPHILRVNRYWIDIVPRGGYLLLSDHRDHPGLIGEVGTMLGNADINISSMLLSRLEPRGPALMVLELDEAVDDTTLRKLQALPEVYTMKLVKL